MSNLFHSFTRLREPLSDNEYLYLLLEPVFIYGVTFGIFVLIIAYFFKHTPFQILSLALIALSSLTIFPYLSMRENVQDRIEQVYHIESPTRASDFMRNTTSRKSKLWLYLVVAITAIFAAIIRPRRNRLGLLFAILCVSFGIINIQYSLWMHYQDALFSHPHLKKSDSPVQQRLKNNSTNQ